MDETTREPRRQAVPPDCEGVWVRHFSGNQVEVYLFVADRWAPGGLSVPRTDFLSGYLTPRQAHQPGDSWEGPFPVPSLASREEADRLREELREARILLAVAHGRMSYARAAELTGLPDDTAVSKRIVDSVLAGLSAEEPRPASEETP